jgi:hypothetical protein
MNRASTGRPGRRAHRRPFRLPTRPEKSPAMNAEPTEPTWSIEMLVLNEALARSRMQQVRPRRSLRGGRRPARVVAAAAARIRNGV